MDRAAITVGAGMDMPIMHDSDRFDFVRDIGSGNFGVARLMRDKQTKDLVAVKYIERGDKIDENVQREIINHRSLRHPNIVRFKEVILTQTHLAIVMEYAAGGELFERIRNAGRFSEDEARFFFQQLISGVSYCHTMQVCHRDLKLENTLLDGSPAPRLKICDFGYSKSSVLHSQPKSTVGTPAYIAPEVLLRQEYDGKSHLRSVWSSTELAKSLIEVLRNARDILLSHQLSPKLKAWFETLAANTNISLVLISDSIEFSVPFFVWFVWVICFVRPIVCSLSSGLSDSSLGHLLRSLDSSGLYDLSKFATQLVHTHDISLSLADSGCRLSLFRLAIDFELLELDLVCDYDCDTRAGLRLRHWINFGFVGESLLVACFGGEDKTWEANGNFIGKIADVWSCGVTLYVMLVGSCPFEDPDEPKDFRKTIQRILQVQYSIPDNIQISRECRHLISRIFVEDPTKANFQDRVIIILKRCVGILREDVPPLSMNLMQFDVHMQQRITIPEIRNHEWFLKNLPADLMDEKTMSNQYEEPDQPMQSIDAIMQIISEATIPPVGLYDLDLDMDDDMEDLDSDPDLDIDSSGEVIYAV
ncbi:hypothetical protein TEA_028362 [Camellia sinensis var. sinensis]|uniref:non-specific serine/threonine protein kinase n=1 Tax=Camellia sinensis var. sinensis TaxID=542762 RepID=A0A4S4DK79_CAMSN|nr:hypothetical protein TEA_028362 [Camellia sinensis var. sinensis]